MQHLVECQRKCLTISHWNLNRVVVADSTRRLFVVMVFHVLLTMNHNKWMEVNKSTEEMCSVFSGFFVRSFFLLLLLHLPRIKIGLGMPVFFMSFVHNTLWPAITFSSQDVYHFHFISENISTNWPKMTAQPDRHETCIHSVLHTRRHAHATNEKKR